MQKLFLFNNLVYGNHLVHRLYFLLQYTVLVQRCKGQFEPLTDKVMVKKQPLNLLQLIYF